MGTFKCYIKNGEIEEVFLPNYLKRYKNYNKRRANINRISLRYFNKIKDKRSLKVGLLSNFKYVRNVTIREIIDQEYYNQILTLKQYSTNSEFIRIKQMNREDES